MATMNRSQRHVTAVALGAVSIVSALAVNRIWNGTPSGGWFMYAPNSDVSFEPASETGTILRTLGVWFVVIGLWTIVTFRLYRSSE